MIVTQAVRLWEIFRHVIRTGGAAIGIKLTDRCAYPLLPPAPLSTYSMWTSLQFQDGEKGLDTGGSRSQSERVQRRDVCRGAPRGFAS